MSTIEIRNILNLLESITLMELTDKIKQQEFDRLQSENPNQDPNEIKKYINAWDAFSQAFPPDKKNITKLPFTEIVKLIRDASFKSSLKGRDTPFHKQPKINRDMDLIYNKNKLEILKGDMKEKCIQYGKNSKWCISRNDSQNMFYTYRMRLDEPTFYFVFDTDRPETDPMHRFVIHIDRNGNYKLTDFDNFGDKELTWDQIEQMQPKLRGLQKLFVSNPLTSEEKRDYEKYKIKANLEIYQNYSLEEKYKYIKFGHELTPEQQDATPKELIGIYAKGLPTKITNKTLKRLNSSDLKKVISDIIDENVSQTSPSEFARNVLQKPWHLSGLPEKIIDQAHKKIADPFYYARYIINTTKDTTQVPDIIIRNIAKDDTYSLYYAREILYKTNNDTSQIPDIIIRSIATNDESSIEFIDDMLAITKDIAQIPEIIIKKVTQDKQSDIYKKYVFLLVKHKINYDGKLDEYKSIIIDKFLEDNEYRYDYDSNSVIIEIFPDISNLAANYGLKNLEYYAKVVDDGYIDMTYNFDVDNTSYAITELKSDLESKNPEIIEKLREIVFKNQLKDGTIDQEEYEEKDLSDIISEDESGEIESAFNSAAYTGIESGTYGEIADTVKLWINDSNFIEEIEDGKFSVKIPYETILNEIISNIGIYMDYDFSFENIFPDFESDYLTDLDEPQYGFDGWDDNTAMESLIDKLEEFIDDNLEESINIKRLKQLSGII